MKMTFYADALQIGLDKVERHKNYWLWDTIQEVASEATAELQKAHPKTRFEVWLPDSGELLKFASLPSDDEESEGWSYLADKHAGSGHSYDHPTATIACVRVPMKGENDLIDHGVLITVDGRLNVEFDDGSSFRQALMQLFRQGTTAQIFSNFVESSLRYRERALAALAEKRLRVGR